MEAHTTPAGLSDWVWMIYHGFAHHSRQTAIRDLSEEAGQPSLYPFLSLSLSVSRALAPLPLCPLTFTLSPSQVNEEQAAAGRPVLANTRNGASGALRLLDPEQVRTLPSAVCSYSQRALCQQPGTG